jgi:hypothetical protein
MAPPVRPALFESKTISSGLCNERKQGAYQLSFGPANVYGRPRRAKNANENAETLKLWVALVGLWLFESCAALTRP